MLKIVRNWVCLIVRWKSRITIKSTSSYALNTSTFWTSIGIILRERSMSLARFQVLKLLIIGRLNGEEIALLYVHLWADNKEDQGLDHTVL